MPNLVNVGASVLYRTRHMYRHFVTRNVWRQFGEAGKRYGVSRVSIAARAIQLYWIGRFLPEESLLKELVDPSVPLSAHEHHLSEERLNGLQDAVNSPNSAMCRDKLMFHAYCRFHGLPVTDLLGVASPHGSRTSGGKPLATERHWVEFVCNALPRAFIVKPRTGSKGRDIRLLVGGGDRDLDSAAALARELQDLERDEDYLLEARIEVHPDIACLTGSPAVSCVRVVTVVDADGNPEIIGAYFRIIVGGSVADNIVDYRTGKFDRNILAMPNLESGLITSAWTADADGIGWRSQVQHPETGHKIVGFQIPAWPELRAIVCDAATAFLPIRTIGWDVAITPSGPVLVEANERYQYAASDHIAGQLRTALKKSLRRKG